jgi:hypothetical protein
VRIVLPMLVALGCLGWVVFARRAGHWGVLPALLALIAGLAAANETRWHVFESRLAAAAAPVLADTDASFGCERLTHHFWSSRAHRGHVMFNADGTPADNAFLSMQTCADIKAFIADPQAADLQQVTSVHILAHEAAHLHGIRAEAEAECVALQADRAVMMNLGADGDTASAAVQRYLGEVYPRLPADYRSTDCQAQGALDRSPGDGAWP